MWQGFRDELHPLGFEIVSVAMDTNGIAAAGPHIEAANPSYPVLLDPSHSLGASLGIINVPMGVWIDEDGVLVRPAELCSAPTPRTEKLGQLLPAAEGRMREMILEAMKMELDTETYAAALRDWVHNGKRSRYALTPEQVALRSAPRPPEVSLAAASFELGQHLHRTGREGEARRFFREAHRLQPENWTYKRQAWSMVDPSQGPTEHYDGDWLTDIRKVGASNYYPKLEM